MKLYYSPGACSLSPHIVLHETGLAHTLVKTDVRAKKTEDGGDFFAINPKGQVPTLQLDSGEVLTEGPAIVQYLADQAPASKLLPPAGSLERVRVQEWLNYVSTEIHKTLGLLFNPMMPEGTKDAVHKMMEKKLTWLDGQLASREYLAGAYSLADIYLSVCLSWAPGQGIDLAPYKNVSALLDRVNARPAVQAAKQAEGLVKKAA